MKAMIVALALVCVASPAFAVTAFFTGNAHPVQTVTYRTGWECQYQYAGQTFWVTETSYCTPTVEVQ